MEMIEWEKGFGSLRMVDYNQSARIVCDFKLELDNVIPKTFANTKHYFECSTDGSIYSILPRKVLLYCLEKAKKSRDTIASNGKRVIEQLFPKVLKYNQSHYSLLAIYIVLSLENNKLNYNLFSRRATLEGKVG